MITALRKVPYCIDIRKSEILDKAYAQMNRKEAYQLEKAISKGELSLTEDIMATTEGDPTDYDSRLLFWDVLRDVDHETALYLVLRHCLGYSLAEVAAGMEVGYNRVRYLTRRKAQCDVARGQGRDSARSIPR